MSDDLTPEPGPAATEGTPARADAPAEAGATVPPTRKRRRLSTFAVTVSVLLLALLVGAGVMAARTYLALGEFQRDPNYMPSGSNRPSAGAKGGPLNVVLIGSDSSNAEDRQDGQRSDTLMIAHVPADRQHVYLISIPRDLWVNVPGLGYSKINAAYDNKGVAGSVEVLENLFDVRMDHVGVVDFEGFVKLMDVMGGVDVWNPFRSEYWYEGEDTPRFVFEEGTIHLQGDYGLAYVRQRHDLPNGDLDRTARQRSVIKAIVAKALSKGVLANPVVLNDFLKQVTPVVKVDSGLDQNTMVGLATSLKLDNGDDVRSMMLPIAGYDTSDDGQSIDVPDLDQITALGKALRNDTMEAYWKTYDPDVLLTNNLPWEEGQAPGSGSVPEPTPTPTASATKRKRGSATPSRRPSIIVAPTHEIPTTTPTAEPS